MTTTTCEPGLDLVVVNYKTPRDLKGFLTSLEQYAPTVPFSLTVYDVEMRVLSPPATGITHQYLADPANCGYAAAVNRSAALGNREVIAAFNADTRFTVPILDDCYHQLMSHDDWGVLGPRQVDSLGRLTHGGITGTNVHPQLRWWMKADGGYAAKTEEMISVAGSAYFVKRVAWDEMWNNPAYRDIFPDAEGAFLPTPHYYEETFCCYHARHLGWKVIYYGGARMIHEWHRASPIGRVERDFLPTSRTIFRSVCDQMGILHD